MKLQNPQDIYSLLTEVNRLDLLETRYDEISPEVFEFFIKRRRNIVPRLKNFRKSQRTKHAWDKNRWTYLKGIRKFHKSMQGKRLHRSMGRFLATRYFLKTKQTEESLELVKDLALKATSSMRTHIYIEQGYYMPLSEQVDFELFTDYTLPILRDIETKLYENTNYVLEEDELELLLRLIDSQELCKALSEVSGVELEKVTKLWKVDNESEETYYLTDLFQSVIKELSNE